MSKSRRIHIKNLATTTSVDHSSSPTPASNDNNPATMNSHYAIGTGGSAVKRIRTPLKHDVLCGRGGGINSHPGNQGFRDIVKERKNAYNLAQNKAEKARVAREVVDLVKSLNPPGRFLERESDSSSGWWIECSMAKALSKTSQALREGAPSIRAAHQQEIPEPRAPASRPSSTRKPRTTATLVPSDVVTSTSPLRTPPITSSHAAEPQQPTTTTKEQTPAIAAEIPPFQTDAAGDSDTEAEHYVSLLAPLVPHQEHEIGRPSKKQRLGEKHVFDSTQETTSSSVPLLQPLLSNREFEGLYGRNISSVAGPEQQQYHDYTTPDSLDQNAPTPPPEVTPTLLPVQAREIPVEMTMLPPPSMATPMPRHVGGNGLQRAHSLALSDVSSDFTLSDFVNPFEDESFIDSMWGQPSQQPDPEQQVQPTIAPQRQFASFPSTFLDRKRSVSQASFAELSDLGDSSAFTKYQESEFAEGMKMVYDATIPSLSSPGSEESIPTHLIPYRGSLLQSNAANRRFSSSATTVPPLPSLSPMQYTESQ